jgi:hypothetical protein
LNSEELISLAEAAVISGLSPTHLNHLARTGGLMARKVGRNWVTTRAAVEDYMRDARKRGNDPHKNRR